MYRLEREEFLKPRFMSLWATLGFQAGFINSFGFLACGRYVSHVTGFGTQMGLAIGEGRFLFALEMLGTPFFFILGAFVNGLITIARLDRGEKPLYQATTLILPLLLLAVSFAGYRGYFGAFGEALIQVHDFVLLFTLAFACGMQNACFATLTKGQIRTTHLTGISTDLGSDLARALSGNLSREEASLIRKTNFTRIATFGSFAAGSVISVMISEHLEYLSLLIPFGTSFAVFLGTRQLSQTLDRNQQLNPSVSGLAAPNTL